MDVARCVFLQYCSVAACVSDGRHILFLPTNPIVRLKYAVVLLKAVVIITRRFSGIVVTIPPEALEYSVAQSSRNCALGEPVTRP